MSWSKVRALEGAYLHARLITLSFAVITVGGSMDHSPAPGVLYHICYWSYETNNVTVRRSARPRRDT